MGLLLFGLNYVLAYRAQIYITSALSAIAFSSMLWMNIINSRVFFGVRAGQRLYFGAFLGAIGICVLFGPQVAEVSLSDGILYGSLLAPYFRAALAINRASRILCVSGFCT